MASERSPRPPISPLPQTTRRQARPRSAGSMTKVVLPQVGTGGRLPVTPSKARRWSSSSPSTARTGRGFGGFSPPGTSASTGPARGGTGGPPGVDDLAAPLARLSCAAGVAAVEFASSPPAAGLGTEVQPIWNRGRRPRRRAGRTKPASRRHSAVGRRVDARPTVARAKPRSRRRQAARSLHAVVRRPVLHLALEDLHSVPLTGSSACRRRGRRR